MSRRSGFCWMLPDLLIKENHLGEALMEMLNARSLYEPGDAVAQSILIGASRDIAAVLTCICGSLRAAHDLSLEFPEHLQAIDFIRRYAKFTACAAEALDCANPASPPPHRNNGSSN